MPPALARPLTHTTLAPGPLGATAVIEVVRAVTDISLKLGECLLSVRPLMAAAKTAQTAPTVLTAVHAQALKIILAAKAYRQGLALLQT